MMWCAVRGTQGLAASLAGVAIVVATITHVHEVAANNGEFAHNLALSGGRDGAARILANVVLSLLIVFCSRAIVLDADAEVRAKKEHKSASLADANQEMIQHFGAKAKAADSSVGNTSLADVNQQLIQHFSAAPAPSLSEGSNSSARAAWAKPLLVCYALVYAFALPILGQ